jgi:hypothetical protein
LSDKEKEKTRFIVGIDSKVEKKMKKLENNEKFNLRRTLLKSKKFSKFVIEYYAGNLIIKKSGIEKLKDVLLKKNIKFNIKYEFLYREKKPYDSDEF